MAKSVTDATVLHKEMMECADHCACIHDDEHAAKVAQTAIEPEPQRSGISLEHAKQMVIDTRKR